MVDDVIIREPVTIYTEYLSWPPDEYNRYGYLAIHWPHNKIPTSENEAIAQAILINKDLFNTTANRTVYNHNPALPKYQVPQFENGSGPPIPSTPFPSPTPSQNTQIKINDWLRLNWKWLIPVAIGAAFIISRR